MCHERLESRLKPIKQYKRDCAANSATLENRKSWFIQCKMNTFLLAVPDRLKGRVDIGLACETVRAYMRLELSNAVSVMNPGV